MKKKILLIIPFLLNLSLSCSTAPDEQSEDNPPKNSLTILQQSKDSVVGYKSRLHELYIQSPKAQEWAQKINLFNHWLGGHKDYYYGKLILSHKIMYERNWYDENYISMRQRLKTFFRCYQELVKQYTAGYKDFLEGKYYLSNPKVYELNVEKGYEKQNWWSDELEEKREEKLRSKRFRGKGTKETDKLLVTQLKKGQKDKKQRLEKQKWFKDLMPTIPEEDSWIPST